VLKKSAPRARIDGDVPPDGRDILADAGVARAKEPA